MALRPAYLLMNVEFDDFLFAAVGEESNGMTLSVISALARLDVDPREKAAQLSRLAVKDAIQTLASLIARLPVGRWELKDASTIATRLISLLPQRASSGRRHEDGTDPRGTSRVAPIVWLICAALLAAGLFGMMQRAGPPRNVDQSSGAVSHLPSPPVIER